jgi:hypothetical protein
MAGKHLESRQEFLLEVQNTDGGWGYAPGKASWIEPTVYAMLSLASKPEASLAVDRAWDLVRSWQLPDGGWRPCANVHEAQWTTALAVTLHCVRKVHDEAFLRGVDWLVETKGAEDTWRNRVLHHFKPTLIGHNPHVVGWPWLPGTSSWVEPASHSLIALRLSSEPLRQLRYRRYRKMRARVRMGERMLLERRSTDGGWNYGNRLVLGKRLPSYSETTAVALLALLGSVRFEASKALELASMRYLQTGSPYARAWLAICLRNYGVAPPQGHSTGEEWPRNVLLAALEALGAPDGNYALLKGEAAS